MERERHASSSSASPADIPLPRQLSNVLVNGGLGRRVRQSDPVLPVRST